MDSYVWLQDWWDLMACQKEESAALAERTEGAAVEWNIVWENTGNSRISLDEAGNGRFTEGDSLSVLAFAGTGMRKVSRLWLEQNRWNSPLTWEDLQAGTVRFTAFYPAASGKMSRESWMHTVPSDQAPKDSLEAADLLWATAEAGIRKESTCISVTRCRASVSSSAKETAIRNRN